MRNATGQADSTEQLTCAGFFNGACPGTGQGRNQHILEYRALRQKTMILKDETDIGISEPRQVRTAEPERILSENSHAA